MGEWLSQPALSLLLLTPSFSVFSCLSKFNAILLSKEKFCAAFSALFLEASSPKATSRHQCSLFSSLDKYVGIQV